MPLLVLSLSFLSGLCTLALQALWTRMFSLVHENSVYSFAVVLFVFLLGLTGGAAGARRQLGRGRPARALLGAAWSVAGLLVAASPRLFDALTGGLGYVSAEGWLVPTPTCGTSLTARCSSRGSASTKIRKHGRVPTSSSPPGHGPAPTLAALRQ